MGVEVGGGGTRGGPGGTRGDQGGPGGTRGGPGGDQGGTRGGPRGHAPADAKIRGLSSSVPTKCVYNCGMFYVYPTWNLLKKQTKRKRKLPTIVCLTTNEFIHWKHVYSFIDGKHILFSTLLYHVLRESLKMTDNRLACRSCNVLYAKQYRSQKESEIGMVWKEMEKWWTYIVRDVNTTTENALCNRCFFLGLDFSTHKDLTWDQVL